MSASLYPHVQTPVDLGSLALDHRVIMGSMHLNFEGASAEALAAFYVERARGGAALMITGGAAVSRVGAGSDHYTLINEQEHQDQWRTVVERVHEAGGRIAVQLFHAGRYAFLDEFGLTPVAPSAVYSRFSRTEPEALTDEGIRNTIGDFAAGARAAREVGFDAIEVMGSEGYLINQFASPLTNLRDDAWGGDAARRRTFPVAVMHAVVDAAGPLPVIARTSGADLMEGSSTAAEADALAADLVRAGASAVNVGIGWHEARVPTVQSMVPHIAWGRVAARVRASLREAGLGAPVIASNRINTLAQAEQVLARGQGDIVQMSRPFLADPHIVATSFAGRAQFVNPCIGCNEACIDRSFGTEPVSCTVNPRAGKELEFAPDALLAPTDALDDARLGADAGAGAGAGAGVGVGELNDAAVDAAEQPPTPSHAGARRRIAVLGSGPAGLEAARAAAFAGAQVDLFESGPRLGGQFLLAGVVPGKRDFLGTVEFFERELARRGVRVHLDSPVTDAASLAAFDHVIVATGVVPRTVAVPGLGGEASHPQVIDYHEAFARPEAVGARVAIIGAGGIAVDLAHFLVEAPLTGASKAAREEERRERFLVANGVIDGEHPAPERSVTIMRRSGKIGAGMSVTTRWAAVQAIRRAGVETLTGVQYRAVEADGVRIDHDDAERLVAADTVIVAAGQEPHAPVVSALAEAGIAHTVVGGALESRGLNAVSAFEQGLRAGDAAARGRAAAAGR